MRQINKNMIISVGVIVISIISSGIIFLSCSDSYLENTLSKEIIACNNEELLTMNEFKIEKMAIEQKFSSEQTNYIAIRFLGIQENQYYLNLTEKDAIKLGISEADFARMQKEIIAVNLLINEWIDDKIDFKLSNPDSIITNDMNISHNIIRLKSGVEPNERIKSFSINNMYFSTSSFFAPSDANSVSITCLGGGLLTGYNVYVSSCGNKNSSNGVGALGTWSTSINLPCSNTNATVGGRTTNSNGGTCRYSW
ncbi:MAG TPA: hypothetical protein GX005_07210 [Bacteroidales bacterium]|nr:hypothetical protein [Bacteroidales bacterium]